MTRSAAIIAAIVCIVLSAGLARAGPAAQPTGDWTGTLRVPDRVVEIGIRVRQTPSGYRGTYEVIKEQVRNIPLAPVRAVPGPAFEVKSPYGVFESSWDRSRGMWRAEWRTKGKVYPFTLRRGYIPPAPLVSSKDRIVLIVIAAVALLEGAAIARLLQLRRRRRLRARSA